MSGVILDTGTQVLCFQHVDYNKCMVFLLIEKQNKIVFNCIKIVFFFFSGEAKVP